MTQDPTAPFVLSAFSVDPELTPREVAPGISTVRALANASWVRTPEGVVVIDTGVAPGLGERILGRIREQADAPVRAVVYTHGHVDHVMGAGPFVEQGAIVYAHENVARRFDRYTLLSDHINHINSVQFGLDIRGMKRTFEYPVQHYHDRTQFDVGGTTFELIAGMGETDDATVVWVPAMRAVFAGDFLVGSFPNIGNPYKVVRYEREWFEMLERILALDPEVIVPGHGRPMQRGAEMTQMLRDNIDALRFLHEQVVWHLNNASTLERAVAEICLPQHLEESPHLRQVYSRIEFAVMNVWRRYTGWYDNHPVSLFPRRRAGFARAVRSLIGDDAKIVAEARALHDAGDQLLALELVHVILDDEPAQPEARALADDVLRALAAGDECLMSANAWRAHLGGRRQ
jgi:alkyl sulfatase BDS1-like metallo-beta-lactamase superfamily hydrolase